MVFRVNRISPAINTLYLGLIASVGLAGGAVYLGIGLDPTVVLTACTITLGIYGMNRAVDAEDAINNPDWHAIVSKHSAALWTSAVVLGGSLLLLHQQGRLTAYHLTVVVVGLCYTFPLVPRMRSYRSVEYVRLKDLTFLKSIAVSATFGTAFVAANWVGSAHRSPDPLHAAFLMISGFLVLFANTNFCDIRDVVGDKIMGVNTIPVRYGIPRTLSWTMIYPSAVWALCVLVSFWSGIVGWKMLLFFLVNAAYPLMYAALYTMLGVSPRRLTTLVDSGILLYASGLFLLA